MKRARGCCADYEGWSRLEYQLVVFACASYACPLCCSVRECLFKTILVLQYIVATNLLMYVDGEPFPSSDDDGSESSQPASEQHPARPRSGSDASPSSSSPARHLGGVSVPPASSSVRSSSSEETPEDAWQSGESGSGDDVLVPLKTR